MVFKRRNKPPFLNRIWHVLYPARGWRRGIEYLGHRIRRLPDTPERIALGFACGAFSSFTPLFGLHILLAIGLARMLRANILANRRSVPPRGICGGGDSAPGRNWVERVDGTREELGATGSAEMQPGDTFVILTPGGGGFGEEEA